jgi:hypothetical protein
MLNFRNFQVGTKAKTATEIDTLQTCAPKHHGGMTNPSRETLPRHAARFGNRIALDKVAGLK